VASHLPAVTVELQLVQFLETVQVVEVVPYLLILEMVVLQTMEIT